MHLIKLGIVTVFFSAIIVYGNPNLNNSEGAIKSAAMLNCGRIKSQVLQLPAPKFDSNTSVESALKVRRSERIYSKGELTLEELSQLLWAAQGITNNRGFRTAPSAGALYPLEIYVAVARVANLTSGVYKYDPTDHTLTSILEGNILAALASAALDQVCIENGAVALVISAVYERTKKKYGERGIRYVHIEAGTVVQNVYLQAVSLNLGTVSIGAFADEKVKTVMNMKINEEPLIIMPIGRKETK